MPRSLEASGPRCPFQATGQSANTSGIEHRFGNAIDANVVLNTRISQRHGAKRCEAKPGSHETKCLTKVAGVNQDGPIRARRLILPLRAAEDGGHQNQRRSTPIPLLTCQITNELARTRTAPQSFKTMFVRRVMIKP